MSQPCIVVLSKRRVPEPADFGDARSIRETYRVTKKREFMGRTVLSITTESSTCRENADVLIE